MLKRSCGIGHSKNSKHQCMILITNMRAPNIKTPTKLHLQNFINLSTFPFTISLY